MADLPHVFLSYRHKDGDQAWLDHLQGAFEEKLHAVATLWSDKELKAGQDWRKEIQEQIARATVGVFLASKDFFDSEFIMNEEFGPLLAKYESGRSIDGRTAQLLIVPIGSDFSAEYEKSKLPFQLVLRPEEALPDAPEGDGLEELVSRVVDEIWRSLDEPWYELTRCAERYEIKRLLSQKPWTRAYEAQVRGGLEQNVVIKTVSGEHERWEFYSNLSQARDLTDTVNMVTVLDADFDPPEPYYYVMQHVSAGSLDSHWQSRRLNWDQVRSILLKTGRAITAAWRRSNSFRDNFFFDLTPSHVMVENLGDHLEPYLSVIGRPRWGGSRLLDFIEASCIEEEHLAEAMAYLLPEDFVDFDRTATYEESHVYLLGLLGHNLLEGRLPKDLDPVELRETSSGQAPTREAIRAMFEVKRLVDTEADPMVPAGERSDPGWGEQEFFKVVLDKMLSCDPQYRFDTVDHALDALDDPLWYALDQVDRSLRRCLQREDFISAFYEKFFDKHGEARKLFETLPDASVESDAWPRHRRKVSSAAHHLFAYFRRFSDHRATHEDRAAASAPLEYLAVNHKARLDLRQSEVGVEVQPEWFDLRRDRRRVRPHQ
ncbi:MAG: toll/interleukin-1 receptor domain-containing protein [Gemmatimonadota bacterium]